jgi:hypothetical protein
MNSANLVAQSKQDPEHVDMKSALDFKIGNRADAAISYAPSGRQYVSRDQWWRTDG